MGAEHMWFLFSFLREIEKGMSKEEMKRVMIEKAVNLKLCCNLLLWPTDLPPRLITTMMLRLKSAGKNRKKKICTAILGKRLWRLRSSIAVTRK